MGDREFQRRRGVYEPRLASYLDKQRQLRGWSVSEYARRAGLNRNSVGAILKGDHRPEPETLLKLTGALQATRPHGPTVRVFQEIEQAALAPG